jgi:hypothetical protein
MMSRLFWSNVIPISPEAQIEHFPIISKPDSHEFSNSAIPRSLSTSCSYENMLVLRQKALDDMT